MLGVQKKSISNRCVVFIEGARRPQPQGWQAHLLRCAYEYATLSRAFFSCHGLAACSQNTAFSSVTEPTVGRDADANTSIISCTEGAWPPDGLCPAYWPHVPRALTHISLDNYEGDCFWEGLATRGIYEQYLYPKMSAEQKAFVVPGTFANADPNNASAIAPRGCTGFYPTASVQQTLPKHSRWRQGIAQ